MRKSPDSLGSIRGFPIYVIKKLCIVYGGSDILSDLTPRIYIGFAGYMLGFSVFEKHLLKTLCYGLGVRIAI